MLNFFDRCLGLGDVFNIQITKEMFVFTYGSVWEDKGNNIMTFIMFICS